MSINMGSADRIIRAIVGIVLLALVFVGPQTPWGWQIRTRAAPPFVERDTKGLKLVVD